MPTNIERLRVAVEEWLIRNHLDADTQFYEMSEWRSRNEEYLNEADLVLVFEGGLYTQLNDGGDTFEFDEYVESFGYFYELGHSWNMGFYPIEGYDFQLPMGTYSQKLTDERWRKKAKLVKERAEWKCQDCGVDSSLEVHHCYYTSMREGNEPWEYPLSALRCLCRKCHEARAKMESRMRAYLARYTTVQIDQLMQGLDRSTYWFKESAVFDLLTKLRHTDDGVCDAISELLEQRNEDA